LSSYHPAKLGREKRKNKEERMQVDQIPTGRDGLLRFSGYGTSNLSKATFFSSSPRLRVVRHGVHSPDPDKKRKEGQAV
jgi:hypothetical protein